MRLTLVVAAATIALVAIAWMLVPRALRDSLVDAIDQHLAGRATPISRAVTDPDDDTVDVGDLRDEVNAIPESFAQVLDPSGRVLAASLGLEHGPLVPAPVLAAWPLDRSALSGHFPGPASGSGC